uniref:Uncharacterized protein n=1 Tax=candidate division WOR-3 bacterium TaxID=2052148 RepID=A0A7C3N8Y6_UNCW3
MKEKNDMIKNDSKSVSFSKLSISIFLLSLVFIFLGYFLLSKGDLKVAPVLLTLAYIVLIPIAIFKK